MTTKAPDGWFVLNAGQDVAHMLWYVQMMNFDDVCERQEDETKKIRSMYVEEQDSLEDAFLLANKQIAETYG